MIAIRIFVEMDEDGQFVLMVHDGRMSAMPAGPRILRGPPHPAIAFSHPTMEAANTDAAKLRAYLAALPVAKASKKRTAESAA